MKDGDTLEFPGLRLKVLETPGHTIESISILVFDLQKDSAKPYAVLTGDTLFIGDVGRPDLRASIGWSANDLGAHLYDSLRNRLLPLPDETLVYPAHGAGSLCGKQLSSDTVSSLGDQRRLNYALQPMSKEEFIRLVTADQPDAPNLDQSGVTGAASSSAMTASIVDVRSPRCTAVIKSCWEDTFFPRVFAPPNTLATADALTMSRTSKPKDSLAIWHT
jgi:hypothetical protein